MISPPKPPPFEDPEQEKRFQEWWKANEFPRMSVRFPGIYYWCHSREEEQRNMKIDTYVICVIGGLFLISMMILPFVFIEGLRVWIAIKTGQIP